MLRIQDSNKLQKINIKRESAKLNQMELYERKQQMWKKHEKYIKIRIWFRSSFVWKWKQKKKYKKNSKKAAGSDADRRGHRKCSVEESIDLLAAVRFARRILSIFRARLWHVSLFRLTSLWLKNPLTQWLCATPWKRIKPPARKSPWPLKKHFFQLGNTKWTTG